MKLFFIVIPLFAIVAHAQTIISNNIHLSKNEYFLASAPDDYEYDLTLFQNPEQSDYTTIFLNVVGGNLIYEGQTPDEGSSWYLVSEGDLFNEAHFSSGQYPSFDEMNPSFAMPQEDFYLAGLTTDPQSGEDVCGWFKFSYRDGVLTSTASATAYKTDGIIVGSTVPEPTGSFFMLAACFTFACHRKR